MTPEQHMFLALCSPNEWVRTDGSFWTPVGGAKYYPHVAHWPDTNEWNIHASVETEPTTFPSYEVAIAFLRVCINT